MGLIYDRLARSDFRLRAYNCPDFDIGSAAVKTDPANVLAAEDEHDNTRPSNFGDKGALLVLIFPTFGWVDVFVCARLCVIRSRRRQGFQVQA